jgi:hypothetical protein
METAASLVKGLNAISWRVASWGAEAHQLDTKGQAPSIITAIAAKASSADGGTDTDRLRAHNEGQKPCPRELWLRIDCIGRTDHAYHYGEDLVHQRRPRPLSLCGIGLVHVCEAG